MAEQLSQAPISDRLTSSEDGQTGLSELVLGDDGKPLAVSLTPEKALAGVEALDALMLLPNIQPDTTVVEAIATLRTQMPIIEQKAKELEDIRNRALAIRSRFIKGTSFLVATGLVGWAGFACYDANFSPAAYQALEAARTIGVTKQSELSVSNWFAHLPEDPVIFSPREPGTKPRVLEDGEMLIVNNRITDIKISDAKLSNGRIVTELIVRYNPQSMIDTLYFYLPSQPTGEAQIIILENLRLGEEAAIAITRKPTKPTTFEVQDLKKTPTAR